MEHYKNERQVRFTSEKTQLSLPSAETIMSDEPALLKAVLSQPDIDAPRLAYADWLSAQPATAQKDRADFIRIQIEIEKLRDADRRWPDLARKERELLEAYRTTWERPFRYRLTPNMLKPMNWLKARLFGIGGSWHFHRGFVAEISTSARQFLGNEVTLFEFAPLRQVVLMNASSMISALIREPRLDRLRSLHLVSDVEFDEDMEGLRQEAWKQDCGSSSCAILGSIRMRMCCSRCFGAIPTRIKDSRPGSRNIRTGHAPRPANVIGLRNWQKFHAFCNI